MIDELPGFREREREKKIAEAEKPHMSCGYIALWSVESAARKVRKVSLFFPSQITLGFIVGLLSN